MTLEQSLTPGYAELVEALTELYQLLEEYAPPWYTQQHEEKALSALRPAKKPRT
jgi:hypothetical protein